jgi:hypothetical protein
MKPIVDPRYGSIKVLIEQGLITSIQDIFKYIPKTTVYKDLGINFNRFDRAILDPSLFRMEELITLADLFNVDSAKIIALAYKQMVSMGNDKGRKTKKSKGDNNRKATDQ